MLLCLLLCSSTLSGQVAQTYGTNSLSWLTLTPWDFHLFDSTTTYAINFGEFGIYPTAGDFKILAAGVRLPAGAIVSALEISGKDSNPNWDLYTHVAVSQKATGAGQDLSFIHTSGMSGWQVVSADYPPFVINNDAESYTLWADFGAATDGSLVLGSVRIGYKLQVSPAPATATFADVPTTHLFYQYIEALAAAGITAGCGGGNFCPDAALTRGQMAVFLSKALGLHWAP